MAENTTEKRPEPGYPPPEGHVHVAKPNTAWRLDTGKPCRFTVAQYETCKAPSVAALNRSAWRRDGKPHWWAYCPDHVYAYGHWVEGGQVLHWVAEASAGVSR